MNDRDKHMLTPEESRRLFQEEILPKLLENTPDLNPSDKPTMVVVGGQPGAGKSTSIGRIEAELAAHGGVLQANVDALREPHPEYRRLMAENDKTASNYTHADAKRWAGMVEDYAKANRYNVMVESLMASPNGMKPWLDDYRQRGYATEVRIVAVNERASWQGVVGRYEAEKARKGVGRTVPHDVHDLAYANVLKTVETIEAEKLADRVVIHSRDGRVLYENQLQADGQWQHVPGARTAIEAERNRSLSPREWREHIQTFDKIEGNQQRPGRNATPADIDEVSQMRAASVREGGLTAQVGLHPTLAKGGVVAGAVATAVDAATTGRETARLYEQGNAEGAQSQILHFGARNVGGWTGAVVGAKLGTLAGIESGPGMVLTGLAGAGIGAWGADQAVAWVEQHRINHQTDHDGHTWSFDPKQPERGWTRTERELDTQAMAASTVDMPIYKPEQTFTADATLTQELNYKASSLAVQLRLGAPDVPIDPYRIAADSTDTPSLRDSPWARNPETGVWTREVADGLIDRTMHTTTHRADAQKKAELDAYAQSTVAYNAARTPAAIAQQYEQTYTAANWSQHGPVPGAVAQAKANDGVLLASDGSRYSRGADGSWTHDGLIYDSQATGNVQRELEATYQAQQQMLGVGIAKPTVPVPDAPELRIAPQSPQERDAYEQALREANRQGVSTQEASQVATFAAATVGTASLDEVQASPTTIDAKRDIESAVEAKAPPIIAPAVPAPSVEPDATKQTRETVSPVEQPSENITPPSSPETRAPLENALGSLGPTVPQPAAPVPSVVSSPVEVNAPEKAPEAAKSIELPVEDVVPVAAATAPDFKSEASAAPLEFKSPDRRVEQGPPTAVIPAPPAGTSIGTTSPAPSLDIDGLRLGDQGPDVEFLQYRLQRAGANGPDGQPVPMDCRFGPETEHAVRQFQQAQGQPATGVADQAFNDTLALVPAVRRDAPQADEPAVPTQTAAERAIERLSPDEQQAQTQVVREAQRQGASQADVEQAAVAAVASVQQASTQPETKISRPNADVGFSSSISGPSLGGPGGKAKSQERDDEALDQAAPSQHQAQTFPTDHKDYALFLAIQQQLPKGTPDEKTAEIMHKAKDRWIEHSDQLEKVGFNDQGVYVLGKAWGSHTRTISLSDPAPSIETTLQQTQALDKQRAEELVQFRVEQEEIAKNPTGPVMTLSRNGPATPPTFSGPSDGSGDGGGGE